jgi:hypothetical protein
MAYLYTVLQDQRPWSLAIEIDFDWSDGLMGGFVLSKSIIDKSEYDL